MRPDDQLDDSDQLAVIRKHALRALENADAVGRFPTPVDAIVEASKHEVVVGTEIDGDFLTKASKSVTGALKRALSKVLGFLNAPARTMHLGNTIHAAKRPFLMIHELGHGRLPWHVEAFALFADCKKTLAPDVADLFECEANAFASEVLFQLDAFELEAADHSFGIKTPLNLSKKYGASVYATIRRYVRTNQRACAVVVLDPPKLVPGNGFIAEIRRVVSSPLFVAQFEIKWPQNVTLNHSLGRAVPIGRRMSRPQLIVLEDANGQHHECIAEGFDSKHQVFVLVCSQSTLTKSTVLLTA